MGRLSGCSCGCTPPRTRIEFPTLSADLLSKIDTIIREVLVVGHASLILIHRTCSRCLSVARVHHRALAPWSRTCVQSARSHKSRCMRSPRPTARPLHLPHTYASAGERGRLLTCHCRAHQQAPSAHPRAGSQRAHPVLRTLTRRGNGFAAQHCEPRHAIPWRAQLAPPLIEQAYSCAASCRADACVAARSLCA